MMEQSLVSSTWAEHFRTCWEGAEEIQPPSELSSLDPLIEIVRHLTAQGKPVPFIPASLGAKCANYDFGQKCQLALLWAIYGKKKSSPLFEQAAEKLSALLIPLIRLRLTTLWSSDSEERAKENQLSAALLLQACGYESESLALYAKDLPSTPFFAFLYRELVAIRLKEEAVEELGLGYRLYHAGSTALALSLCGKGVGLGAFRVGALSVPAFGPQGAPFSDLKNFGIDTLFSNDGWFRPSASKQCWMQIDPRIDLNRISFRLKSVGMDPNKPLLLAFYISADQCFIGGKEFKPKSLNRFSGEAAQIQFGVGGSSFRLILDQPRRVELIPLAGEGCFWSASYLMAFSLPAFDTAFSYTVES